MLDTDITRQSQDLLKQTGNEYGSFSHDSLAAFTNILSRGGKRLRGALVMASYEMLGGRDSAMIIQVARAVEMIHAYLLIIDDIADNSAVRRGGPSAHTLLATHHQTNQLQGNSQHFGTSAATYAALIGFYEAEGILMQLELPATLKLQLLEQLRSTLITTYHGQLLDTYNEATGTEDETKALRVSELKTAYYSIVNPLQVGALLAGGTPNDFSLLQEYGQQAGIAFQISDDIMGIFGNEAKTGKSAKDDLREGKRTILITYTLTHANAHQRQQLLSILGKADVTDNELLAARQIIEATGGLTYAKQTIQMYVQKAQEVLKTAPAHWDKAKIQFLTDLAHSLVDREV